MKSLFFIITLLGLVGCQTFGVTPEQAAIQIDRAAEARESLWINLQIDKAMFSDEEWSAIENVYGQAVELAAEIEVGLSLRAYPQTAAVEEWLLVGGIVYSEAETILEPRSQSLSPRTRAAWAVEKARLKALARTGADYVANPNSGTYQALARVGMTFLGLAL